LRFKAKKKIAFTARCIKNILIMNLSPFLVTKWDGCHLWLQWEDVAAGVDPSTGNQYRARYRLREPGKAEFGRWIEIGLRVGRAWIKFPTHKRGWEAQAQVAAKGSRDWATAQIAVFRKSRCSFRIQSGRKVAFKAGDTVHAMVHGEPASYRFLSHVEVSAGKSKVVELEAVRASGFNQIDKPGDFRTKPKFDLLIENTGPSSNDIVPVSEPGIIDAAEPDGPMTVVFHPPVDGSTPMP
jgi:hypothetical protein